MDGAHGRGTVAWRENPLFDREMQAEQRGSGEAGGGSTDVGQPGAAPPATLVVVRGLHFQRADGWEARRKLQELLRRLLNGDPAAPPPVPTGPPPARLIQLVEVVDVWRTRNRWAVLARWPVELRDAVFRRKPMQLECAPQINQQLECSGGNGSPAQRSPAAPQHAGWAP